MREIFTARSCAESYALFPTYSPHVHAVVVVVTVDVWMRNGQDD